MGSGCGSGRVGQGFFKGAQWSMQKRFSNYPTVREPCQVPKENGIKNLPILWRRQMALEQPAQGGHIHRRTTIEQKPAQPMRRKLLSYFGSRLIRNIPNYGLGGDEIFVARPHRPIMKIVIRPVMRKAANIYGADLTKALRRNQHSPAARRMFYRYFGGG